MNRWNIAAISTTALALATPLAISLSGQGAAQSTTPAGGDRSEGGLTREMLTEDTTAPRVQPAEYDLTIVKYTDYQCPYCRQAHVALQQLLAEDNRIRIIYRDWPVFGAPSVTAARLAIASKWQNKHAQFHDALMRTTGRLSDASIRAAADRAGVDWARLQRDLQAHEAEIDALLARNSQQAAQLGLQGTPGFIIGTYLIPGGMDLANLRAAVREARTNPQGPPQEVDDVPPIANTSGM